MIRGRLLDMGGDEALFYLAYDSMLVVASIHDPSLVLVCTRRCYTSADSHDVSRLDVFPPRRDGGGAWDAEGGENSEGEGSGAAAGLTGTVLVGGGGVDMGGHWGAGGMAGGMGEDGMETFHALHGMDAAHMMLGLPGEVPRVAMSGKAVVCAELADSSLVSLRVWFGNGPTFSKAMDRARCKRAVQRLLVRDVPRNVKQQRQPDLVHHAALDYFFMLLAVTSLKMEEMEAKGEEELLAPNLASGPDRPDHAPGAANPVVQDSVEAGMAGLRMEELHVCLQVARVRRGCGNKEVRSRASLSEGARVAGVRIVSRASVDAQGACKMRREERLRSRVSRHARTEMTLTIREH